MEEVLNRGTTVAGQKRAASMSAAYARARAKKALPKPESVPIERFEEDIIARLKSRKKSAAKSAAKA